MNLKMVPFSFSRVVSSIFSKSTPGLWASPFEDDLAENREPRTPFVVIADTSASTRGDRITEISAGFVEMTQMLRDHSLTADRAQMAIVTCGGHPQIVMPFTPIHVAKPPILKTGGCTPLGEATLVAIEYMTAHVARLRNAEISVRHPLVLLFTDGEPTSSPSVMREAAAEVRGAEDEGVLDFFAFGTEDANLRHLRKLAHRHEPTTIRNLRSFFHWLGRSVRSISVDQIDTSGGLPALPFDEIDY